MFEFSLECLLDLVIDSSALLCLVVQIDAPQLLFSGFARLRLGRHLDIKENPKQHERKDRFYFYYLFQIFPSQEDSCRLV